MGTLLWGEVCRAWKSGGNARIPTALLPSRAKPSAARLPKPSSASWQTFPACVNHCHKSSPHHKICKHTGKGYFYAYRQDRENHHCRS